MSFAHKVAFVTSNIYKVKEIQHLLDHSALRGKFHLTPLKLKTLEIQEEHAVKITRAKLLNAVQQLRVCGKEAKQFQWVMVEDTSLCINALGGLPGPYVKYFEDKIGPNGIFRILADYPDKSALAECHIGISHTAEEAEEETEPHLEIMIGHCKGQIVAPQGSQEFGWDACFQPEGFNLPFSCLEPSVKNVISHRARAFNHLIKHFQDSSNV